MELTAHRIQKIELGKISKEGKGYHREIRITSLSTSLLKEELTLTLFGEDKKKLTAVKANKQFLSCS